MRILIFLLCLIPFSVIGQQINGKICSGTSFTPVQGAVISFYEIGISIATNEQGLFYYSTAFPSEINYTIEKEGFETVAGKITFPISDTLIFQLERQHLETEDIEIIVSRGILQRESVAHIEVKSINELNTVKSTNLGESLAKIPGVYLASTGNGISKPIIRGLGGNRVVTLLNGIRVENQQWGSDHGMAINSLGIENVEIIKGPASLYFGSDALAGVVYVIDENYTQSNVTEEKIGSSFEWNGKNTQSFAAVKLAENRLRMNIFAGLNSSSDFSVPSKKFLINSRYQDQLAKIAIGYSSGIWVTNLRYAYSASTVGIVGESSDSIPTTASYLSSVGKRRIDLPFQQINNHILSWENKLFLPKSKVLQIQLGNTYNALNEFEESKTQPSIAMRLNSSVYTIRLNQRIANQLSYIIGVQGMLQQNRNLKSATEQLIPNANSIDNGCFLVVDGKVNNWQLQGGLRADWRSIGTRDDSSAFHAVYHSLTFSTGVLKRYRKNTLRINGSSGFRAPHTSELLANGAHDGALRFEIGSTSLKTEKATQLDISFEFANEHISLFFNPFTNYIRDYIYLAPIDSMIENKPVYCYQQANSVYLFGSDFGVHLHPHKFHGLHLESTFSYVRGIQSNGKNLSFIPQPRINTLIKLPIGMNSQYKYIRSNYLAIAHSFYFAQPFVSEFESRTKHYQLFDISFNMSISKTPEKIQLSGGIKNIFNVEYINHLSSLKNIGVMQQGRNIYLGFNVHLEQKKE